MNEESWIDETMEANEYVGRATASEDLIGRLKTIPSAVKSTYTTVPQKMVWAAAACVAVLICINVFSFAKYQSTDENASQNGLEESYFSYLEQL